MRALKQLAKRLMAFYSSVRVKGKPKIFCIGMNKTGTTSLEKAFKDLGFVVGDQKTAERLLHAYQKKDFDSIVNYCHTAQVFQDFPFSFPETYKYLDKAFPNARFILSVRDTPGQWYNSVLKFHTKLFAKGVKPTVEDLKNAKYVWIGWTWETMKLLYGLNDDSEPYDKEQLIGSYTRYNNEVMKYFEGRDNFLLINLSEEGAYRKFCSFLNITSKYDNFPWENKTSDLKTRR